MNSVFLRNSLLKRKTGEEVNHTTGREMHKCGHPTFPCFGANTTSCLLHWANQGYTGQAVCDGGRGECEL